MMDGLGFPCVWSILENLVVSSFRLVTSHVEDLEAGNSFFEGVTAATEVDPKGPGSLIPGLRWAGSLNWHSSGSQDGRGNVGQLIDIERRKLWQDVYVIVGQINCWVSVLGRRGVQNKARAVAR
jgi:hypothetical protein